MASNYDNIRAANIREYGEGTRHLSFLGRLYTERTHFIYELLQNAEDASATKVLFDLHPDRLEFWHDGRPFGEQDVRGVCGVGEGTKAEDLTKIGKFGIGFKSVYAYTMAPAIHSGDEAFCIEHYVRPYAAAARPLPGPWTTLLVFPFNHSEVPAAQATQEIGRFLWKLDVRTLLFLRNIAELRWNIHGGASGSQSRDTRPQGAARRVMLVSQGSQSAERQRESEWLVFERAVALQPGAPTVNRVEIAFRLTIDAKTSKENLVAAPDSRLIVFFPTDKDTRLGFLVQGPYRTTPARDNIPQKDPLNCRLVQETATLLVESLKQLCTMNLLTVSLLEALPIRPGDFPKESMFRPIFDAVRQALREQPLFPAHGGGFVAAQKAKLARGADLLDLFTPRQLGELLRSNESYQWITGEIKHDRAPDLYRYLLGQPNRSDDDLEATGPLIERLEIRPEIVVSNLTTELLRKPGQTDRWMVKLYLYLADHREQWEALKKKPFLRLQDQSHVVPFRDGKSLNAYLPTADSSTFRTVKREIADHPNVRDFLIALGLREPSVVAEVVERILPKYHRSSASSISDTENRSDVQKILRALGTDSQIEREQVADAIKKTPFLRAVNATGKHRGFKKPDELYLRSTALQAYFQDYPDAWFLDEETVPEGTKVGFNWTTLGIATRPKRIEVEAHLSTQECLKLREGSKCTSEKAVDIDLDGLEHFLKNVVRLSGTNNSVRPLVLWNFLLAYLRDLKAEERETFFKGNYIWFYRTEYMTSFDACFLNRLRKTAWLPSKADSTRLYKPVQLSLDQLPEEFKHDDMLIRALEMRPDTLKLLAQEIGINIEDLRFLQENREEFSRWKRRIKGSTPPPSPPPLLDYRTSLATVFARPQAEGEEIENVIAGILRNPAMYRERAEEDIRKQIELELQRGMRFKTVPRTVWEAKNNDIRTFLAEQYYGTCQICQQGFKRRDNLPYYEGLYLVSYTHAGWVDNPGNVLCLCATCCAKMQHGAVEADNVLGQIQSHRALRENGSSQPALRLRLCGQPIEIRFTERHMLRLQALLNATAAPTKAAT